MNAGMSQGSGTGRPPRKGKKRTARLLSYKYQRLRERLREAIDSGALTGRLPGERELARQYEANAKTLNKALADLAMDGLLVRLVGRGTFVAARNDSTQPTRSRTYGWTIQIGPPPTGDVDVYTQAARLFETAGHRLKRVELDAEPSPETRDRTLTLSRLRDLSGLVVFGVQPPERLLAELNRRRLPTVIANNRHTTARTQAVLADYAHGAFELTQHLIQLGHQDIHLVIDPRLLPAATDAVAGHQAAMRRYGLSANESVHANDGWISLLQKGQPASALVCVGTQPALQAVRFAADTGLRIPEDLSLATITESNATQPAGRHFTAYEVPVERIVEWAAKLLLTSSLGKTPQIVLVPGQLHVRGSTAKPSRNALSPVPAPDEVVV